jgi:hypothetical protein
VFIWEYLRLELSTSLTPLEEIKSGIYTVTRNSNIPVTHIPPPSMPEQHKFVHLYRYPNKKFWEELIAYSPWYDTGHIENETSKNPSTVACVFVTSVTFLPIRCLATIEEFLPSRCLATIRGFLPSRCLTTIGGHTQKHTHTQTATWSHKPTLFFKIRKKG